MEEKPKFKPRDPQQKRRPQIRDKYLKKDQFEFPEELGTQKVKPNEEDSQTEQLDQEEEKGEFYVKSGENNDDFINNLKLPDLQQFIDFNKNNGQKMCEGCQQMKQIYCAQCTQIVQLTEQISQLQLPVKLVVIHHDKEVSSKSSALPIRALCDKNTEIVYFPSNQIPKFDQQSTCLLYPHKNSKKLSELTTEQIAKIKTVVAIDCTWFQTTSILNNIQDDDFQFIRLEDYTTTFWRYQFHMNNCLATAEAIYFFYLELDRAQYVLANKDDKDYQYDGRYDQMLFFYALNYRIIQEHYKQNKDLQFQQIQGYIKYSE